MRRLAILLVIAAPLPAIASGSDNAAVRRVPVDPPGLSGTGSKNGFLGLFGKKSKRACIDVGRIAGAVVADERTVELTLYGGERWRMRFKRDCPALSYYQGFYYRRAQPGKLCAGRDAIIARSGGACAIDSLARDRRGD